MKRPRLRTAALLAAAVCLAAPRAARAQIRGSIVDAATNAPVSGAAVRLLGTDAAQAAATLSADNGSFTLSGAKPGEYTLVVERIGYATEREPVRLRPGGFMELTVSLQTSAIALDTLKVEARSPGLEIGGYYARKQVGAGVFLERAQFMTKNPHNVADILGPVSGARVARQNGFVDVIMRGTFPSWPNCLPLIYLNGSLVVSSYNAPAGGASGTDGDWGKGRFDLAQLTAEDIDAIEVYTSKAGAPTEFIKADSECGAVLIWTRSR